MINPHAKAVEAAVVEAAGFFEWRDIDEDIVQVLDIEDLRDTMAAAITAYLAAMRAEGWVMVPSAATVDMVAAAITRPDYGASTTLFYGEIYRAMIDAAMLKGAGDGHG